jgi:hypothetical protein
LTATSRSASGLPFLRPMKDRPVDQAAVRRLAEAGEKIDRLAVDVEPAGVPPAGAHHDVGALLEHPGDAVRLQIGAVGDADLAFNDGDPIERLAALLIGEREEAEALAGKVESAVDAPELVARLGQPSRLRNRRRVDDPDQTAAARLRRGGAQRFADQKRQPIAGPAQALKQRNIGKIGKPDRRRPRSSRSKPSPAQAIGQDQAQQIDGGRDGPRPRESLCAAGAALKARRPAKPGDNAIPIPGHKGFASHPMLESHAIPGRKSYVSAYGP